MLDDVVTRFLFVGVLAMLLVLARDLSSVGAVGYCDFAHVGGDYPIHSLLVLMILFEGESLSQPSKGEMMFCL